MLANELELLADGDPPEDGEPAAADHHEDDLAAGDDDDAEAQERFGGSGAVPQSQYEVGVVFVGLWLLLFTCLATMCLWRLIITFLARPTASPVAFAGLPIGSTDLAKMLLRISACALATACLALLWAWCMRVATVWCASVSVLLGLALVQVAAIAAFVLAWYADLQGNAIIGGSSSMAAAAESSMLMTVLAASPSTCVIVGAVAQSAVVVALVLLLLQRRSWRLSLSMLALELRAFDRPHAGTTRLLVASMLAFYVTWFCLWALTVLLAQQAWSVWRPAVFIIYTLCALNWYWTTQVCKNVLRVAIGALQARHYLALEDSEAERHPIRFAFSRAFGPHFASICLGSLLLPPNELVCQSLSVVTAAVGCGHTLKAMVIGPFARLANKFSLHYLAIYGSPFLRAANSVWLQLSRTGVDMIHHDLLVGVVLLVSVVVLSSAMPAVCSVLLPALFGQQVFWLELVLAVLGATGASSITFAAIDASLSCFLVCFSETPAPTQHLAPQLYDMLRDKYRTQCPRLFRDVV